MSYIVQAAAAASSCCGCLVCELASHEERCIDTGISTAHSSTEIKIIVFTVVGGGLLLSACDMVLVSTKMELKSENSGAHSPSVAVQ